MAFPNRWRHQRAGLLAAAVAACGGGPAERATADVEVLDSAGVVLVSNPVPLER